MAITKKNGAMRKDNRSILYGFTVAEILISMAIVMIVATSMVPILGTNKVKRPNNRMNHGVAVCYYDENGNLNYEFRENKAGGVSRSGLLNNTDHCEFTVPKANYVEIIAIGAGGASTYDDFSMQIVGGQHSGNGTLRIDNHFQEDIEHAAKAMQDNTSIPEKIRTTMNEWATEHPNQVRAVYTNIQSPIGAGGTAKCMRRVSMIRCIAPESAGSYYEEFTGDTNNENSGCWWYQHGKGGDSGTGLAIESVSLPLNGSSTIKLYDDTSRVGVTIRDELNNRTNSFILTASGNGGDASCGSRVCTNGQNSNQNASCTSQGPQNWCANATNRVDGKLLQNKGVLLGTEVPETQQCIDNKMSVTPGSISYQGKGNGNSSGQGAYQWYYQSPAVNATFGERGEYGTEVEQIYENLKGVLHLYPARTNSSGNGLTRSEVRREDGSVLMSASSREDKGQRSLDQVPISRTRLGTNRAILSPEYEPLSVQMPAEILEFALPNNIQHFRYIEKLTNAGYNLPILRCKAEGNCPGFAGTGTYLYIGNSTRIEFLTLTNLQANMPYAYTKYFDEDDEYKQLDPSCINNDRLENYPGDISWAHVCKGRVKNGGRGAIVLIW